MLVLKTVPHFIYHILESEPVMVPVFVWKVDLSDAYIHVWLRSKKTPALVFLVFPELTKMDPLIWENLVLPMVHAGISTLFLMITEIVLDTTNNSWIPCDTAGY